MKSIRLTTTTIILLFSVFNTARTESLTDPYEILNRHYEAIGGLDKLKAEKTVYFEGTIILEGTGLQGTFKQWYTKPLRMRQEVDLHVMKQTTGDNGHYSWVVDANEKLLIAKDEKTLKERTVKKLLADYDHLNRDSPNFQVIFQGIETIGDIDCYLIKITNSVNEDVQFDYYNTTHFYLEKRVKREPDQEIHTIFSDYRDVNGVQHAFLENQKILPIGQNVTVKINKYETNRAIDNTVFELPGQDVEDFTFLKGESAENIPFQFIEEHIYLSVNINGKVRLWILDSGAGKTVIDSLYASELGLQLEGTIKGKGAGHTVDVSFTTLPPFTIQGLHFNEQKIVSIDVSLILRRVMGLDVVGILGYDFLSRFVTRIDYAHKTLSFYDPDKFQYRGTGKVIDAPLKDNFFVLSMIVDGKYSGKWHLDLGAGGLDFHYPFAEENDLLNLPGVDRVGFGAGGEIKSRTSQFHTLELEGFVIENPLISIPRQRGEGAFASKELIGNIGNALLRQFVLYLDYRRQQVILEKGADFGKKFPRDKSGLQILLTEDGDGYEVFFIAENTPAEKAGFKKGDVIQSINGIKVDYLGGIVAMRELLREKAGTKYTFKVMRTGKTREIILELRHLY